MKHASPLLVRSFDHVTLICADLEATRKFYVELLGLEEVTRPAFPFPGMWFQVGSVQIHATKQNAEAGQAGWGDRGARIVARGHHIAFAVDDVGRVAEVAMAHSVPIASPLQTRPDGFRQIYLYDPDGHVVELVSD